MLDGLAVEPLLCGFARKTRFGLGCDAPGLTDIRTFFAPDSAQGLQRLFVLSCIDLLLSLGPTLLDRL